jgi:hypothetical protein
MAIGPYVNALAWIAIGEGREVGSFNDFAKLKSSPSTLEGGKRLGSELIHWASGAKTGWFNQADLITPGCEFTALIALNNHTATGLDPNDAGSNPAKGRGFEHFYDIAGL